MPLTLKMVWFSWGLLLVHQMFSIFLRCSLSVSHSLLEKYDALLRCSIQRITNNNSNLTDSQWIQASLPVRDGGLEVRWVASLAIPAFIASAASTLLLQAHLLSGCGNRTTTFSKLNCQPGQIHLVRCRRLYSPNNLSETGLVCLKVRHWWKPLSVLHIIGLPFLLPPLSTVEIGCSPSLLPHVALSWMTRRWEWQWAWSLGLICVSHTSVTAVLLWTLVGFIALFARQPRAGQRGTKP